MMNMLDSDFDSDNYTETSDSEDQDDRESTFGGNAQSILSSLDESIGKIDDFLSYERGFVHGDVVCSVTDPSGQLGRVVDVDMLVDLETTSGLNGLMKSVSTKLLQKLRTFAPGDYVVHGPFLGRVDRVQDSVTVLFNDGAKCEILTGESEILLPVHQGLFEDAPYFYYPGQRVRIKLPSVSKSVRWLCGSWNVVRNEGTICNVEVGLVYVNWIASVITNSTSVPPPNIQNPKNLTLLSCFPNANWQIGDSCLVPFECYENLNMSSENSSTPNAALQFNIKTEKLGMNDQYHKSMYVIAKTKTKVHVLWQNGDLAVGLDSQMLFPVNNVGDHDFWPGQLVLEKVSSEDENASSGPRLGIVKTVDAQDRTVKVKWKAFQGEGAEEIVSAYELVEHPDFSYCIGDIVFRTFMQLDNSKDNHQDSQIGMMKHDLPHSGVFNSSKLLEKEKNHSNEGHSEDSTAYLSSIGNVIGFKDGEIEVRWATGVISKVQPSEIFGLDRLGDLASIPTTVDESVPESVNKEVAEPEREYRLHQEKVANDSAEAYEKDWWGIGSFFFPCASIGFLKSVASSICGSGASSSLLGFWKGVPEFQALKTEEAQLDANEIEPEILNGKIEEAGLKETLTSSISNEKTGVFKQFDIVDDYSEHHFVDSTDKGAASQIKKSWLKKVQQEWGILKRDLPDSIYVRVYEERIDLLRACIVGAPETPYHDGLFFFDIIFPPDYPHEPPLVHYISGGLRLNPNLYESGKVCLSLLKTWTGTGSEMWEPGSSTILQVLLSLQALVLNDKPYFNEAGYDKQIGRAEGEKNSITYNENAFILSCKSMLYVLRKPPKHFEDIVNGHFARRAHSILLACKAYMDGAPVGSPLESAKGAGVVGQDMCSTGFKIMLAKVFPKLVSGFTEKGIDCSQFLVQGLGKSS